MVGQIVKALKRCPLRVTVAVKQQSTIRGGRRRTKDGSEAWTLQLLLVLVSSSPFLVAGRSHRRAVLQVLLLPQILREVIGLAIDLGIYHRRCPTVNLEVLLLLLLVVDTMMTCGEQRK
jgi:hypothetical protein